MAGDYTSLIPVLAQAAEDSKKLHALVGFDGTVDVICQPVESRKPGETTFTPFERIRDFGTRITDADEKSALIEIVRKLEKIGGNGPIMANALAASGVGVDYIGSLGKSQIHPVYSDFAERITVHPVADPAVTHAMEFSNGKVMLADLSTYEEVTAETLDAVIGKGKMQSLITRSQLYCLLNWICLPGYESILSWHLESVLPDIERNLGRIFFFDLADPSMRSKDDLLRVLNLIKGFVAHGRVVLGLNLNETQQVCQALDLEGPEDEVSSISLGEAAEAIRTCLGIDTILSHPTSFAACSTPSGQCAVAGPYTHSPKITTGAGDHLNAGFCLGLMLNFSPEDALKLGVLYSGYYVRTGEAPNLSLLPEFIQSLKADQP